MRYHADTTPARAAEAAARELDLPGSWTLTRDGEALPPAERLDDLGICDGDRLGLAQA